jgi:hypothetical protein
LAAVTAEAVETGTKVSSKKRCEAFFVLSDATRAGYQETNID